MVFRGVREYFQSNHSETFLDRTKLVTNVILDSLILVAVVPFLLFAQWAVASAHLHGIPALFVEGIEIFLAGGAFAVVGAKVCGEVYGTFKEATKDKDALADDGVDDASAADDPFGDDDDDDDITAATKLMSVG
jgi:hypothetical protein